MKSVAKINAAIYGGLVKILSVLAQGKESTDVISIKEGILIDHISTGTIKVDFTGLLGKVNLDFLHPVETVKLMKLLRGGSEFVFLDNDTTYSVTNLISTITIRKAAAPSSNTYPELGELKSQIILDSETVGLITEAFKTLEAESLIIECDAATLKPVRINIKDEYEYKLDAGHEGELKQFKILNFAPIKGSEYTFKIYKNNDKYLIETVADLDIVDAQYCEIMKEVGEFDSFSLI